VSNNTSASRCARQRTLLFSRLRRSVLPLLDATAASEDKNAVTSCGKVDTRCKSSFTTDRVVVTVVPLADSGMKIAKVSTDKVCVIKWPVFCPCLAVWPVFCFLYSPVCKLNWFIPR